MHNSTRARYQVSGDRIDILAFAWNATRVLGPPVKRVFFPNFIVFVTHARIRTSLGATGLLFSVQHGCLRVGLRVSKV